MILCNPLVKKEETTRKRYKDEQRHQMNEKERHGLDGDATVLISSTSEDSKWKFSMEEYNIAMPGPSTSDISLNVLNPDLAAALDLQK